MYADILKAKKREMGWTTEELSARSGVPLGTINKILNGETRSPRYDTMQALDAAFEKEEKKGFLVKEALTYEYGRDDRCYSVEDYYGFPDEVRVELIDGRIFYMASPSTVHQITVTQLIAQSMAYIGQKNGDCVPLTAPMDVQLDCDAYTMLQPDFMVVCDPDMIQKDRIYGAPDFVAEVLSPSSRHVDGNIKLRKYLAAGVREYWIIDTERRRVISYFAGDDYIPCIYSMDTGIPVKIFDEGLKIVF